jgi:hypothetical protein
MSKVTITFDMPEESEQCELALRARQLYAALVQIDNRARSVLKHSDGADEARDALIEIRSEISDALEGLR